MMIDQAKRDAIISKSAKWLYHDSSTIRNGEIYNADTPHYGGGIALFAYLSLSSLEELVAEGFASAKDATVCAHSLGGLMQFLRSNPHYTVKGYVVEAERIDCRVTITELDPQRV